MFITALFTTAKKWKQLKCPLTDEWINKMWGIHTVVEYYSASKRRGILQYAAAWMNLEDIVSSGTSQTQKDKCRMIPLT